jgi:hypothetical protein
MALTPLQWSCINHIVAYELSPPDNRLSDIDFCEMIGIDERSLQRYQAKRFRCAKCKDIQRDLRRKDPPAADYPCAGCGPTEWVDMGPAYPDFFKSLTAALKDAHDTNDYFSLRTRQWALEELVRLYKDKNTTDTNKRHILKAIREETADSVPQRQVTDFAAMPDEELERLMLAETTDAERAFSATVTGEVTCLDSSQDSSPEDASAEPSQPDSGSAGKRGTQTRSSGAKSRRRSSKNRSTTR